MNAVKNGYTSYEVLTDNGFKNIYNINFDDIVCGWNGEEYHVYGIDDSISQDVYDITFSDGRHALYGGTEMIYTGKEKCLMYGLSDDKSRKFSRIDQHEFVIPQRGITNLLYPDPYTAGALLIHGHYDIPYINLPLDRAAACDLMYYKYNISDCDIPITHSNTVTFKWNGNGEPVTWKQFFRIYDMYVTTGKKTSPIIANEYMYAYHTSREKFIMGIFDTGYNKEMFPDRVAIAHFDENRLKYVQKMLWSLGVSSKIEYNPNLPVARGRDYILTVLSEAETRYPGFFYDISSIRRQILNRMDPLFTNPPFEFKIENIRRVNKSFMNRLILDKKEAIFVSNNYLPRVSK